MIENQINEIMANASKAKTPFPETYLKLKKINLINYTVDVATFTITYKLKEGKFTKKNTKGFNVSGVFSAEDIKQAIDYHDKYKTSFHEFVDDIARCGCASYEVDFKNDQIIYYNNDKTKSHAEPIELPKEKVKPTYLSRDLKKVFSKPSPIYFFPVFGSIVFMKTLFTLQEEAGLFDSETPGGSYLNEATKKWMTYLSIFLPIIIFLSSLLFNFSFFFWKKVTKKAIRLNEESLIYKDFGSF